MAPTVQYIQVMFVPNICLHRGCKIKFSRAFSGWKQDLVCSVFKRSGEGRPAGNSSGDSAAEKVQDVDEKRKRGRVKGEEGRKPPSQFGITAEPTPSFARESAGLAQWVPHLADHFIIIMASCENINSWAPSQRLKVTRSRSETWESVSNKSP